MHWTSVKNIAVSKEIIRESEKMTSHPVRVQYLDSSKTTKMKIFTNKINKWSHI